MAQARPGDGVSAAPGLDALAAGVVSELDAVTSGAPTGSAEGTEYRRAGRVFAIARPGVLEVRLPADIAEAALRTPDTGPSTLGADWIHFAPRSSEPHVQDRASAWLITAWRHAIG